MKTKFVMGNKVNIKLYNSFCAVSLKILLYFSLKLFYPVLPCKKERTQESYNLLPTCFLPQDFSKKRRSSLSCCQDTNSRHDIKVAWRTKYIK